MSKFSSPTGGGREGAKASKGNFFVSFGAAITACCVAHLYAIALRGSVLPRLEGCSTNKEPVISREPCKLQPIK
jgi:hypothetical protein